MQTHSKKEGDMDELMKEHDDRMWHKSFDHEG